MVRITPTVLSGMMLFCAVVGCAHFVETQAITGFTAALDKGDLDKLNDTTSDTFKKNALRRKDAVDALKILPLHPEEKVTIVKVKDVSDDKKKVEVTTDKSHRKMEYLLVRDPKSNKWVVEDIYVKQRGRDVTAVKSVTEQMDLLLVVQDFLVAWHKGKRDEVQDVTTVNFGKLLAALPAAHLERLTKKVAGERIRSEEFRPEATIDGNDAVVKLQRASGILVLTMKRTKKGWKVADVAVESRKDKDKEHLASARKTATVIRVVVDFLKAYKEDDKPALEKVVASRFFDECLKVADLKTIPLPAPDILGDKDVVKTHDKGGEYLLRRGPETVKITLTSGSAETKDAPDETYSVDNVTIYDSKQEKRLSALFTAEAKMQLFMKAVLRGNLTLVRKNSTADLRGRIWNKLGSLSLADILPPEIELATPVINGRDFHDAAIRIHVHQGSRELTYILRDWAGEVTVDDVLMPVMDRPSSMKETMQIMLPIRLFLAALHEASLSTEAQDAQLQLLKSVTSNDFNRVVWSQLNQIPEAAFAVLPHLDLPLASVTDTPTGHTVVLGNERFGARVDLNRERDTLVVDHIYLVSDPQSEPSELKRSLKSQLAKRGPRGLALDPISSYPIATDPPAVEASEPEAPSKTSAVVPASGAVRR